MYDNYAKIRDSMGLTDYQVAQKTGISRGTFSNWKTNKRNLNSTTLQKIADYLGVPVDAIITGEKKEENQYWINEETSNIAQEIFKNKELKLLFSSAKDSKPEDLKIVTDMLIALKNKEKGNENV